MNINQINKENGIYSYSVILYTSEKECSLTAATHHDTGESHKRNTIKATVCESIT